MSKKVFGGVVCNLVICAVIAIVFVSTLGGTLAVSNSGAIYKGSAKDKVSIMFNVYWGTEYLSQILDVLDEEGIKTTFFVGGSWAAENPVALKEIFIRGHEIGNHGYYHKEHKKLAYNRNREEILITHKVVKETLGIEMNLFAPPSGSYGEATLKAAQDLNYKTVMWTLDTIDWRDKDVALIVKRATEKAEGGSLILAHPTACTLEALKTIIATLKSKGLTIAPVSEVIESEPKSA